MTFNYLIRSTFRRGGSVTLPHGFLPRLRGRIKVGVLDPPQLVKYHHVIRVNKNIQIGSYDSASRAGLPCHTISPTFAPCTP